MQIYPNIYYEIEDDEDLTRLYDSLISLSQLRDKLKSECNECDAEAEFEREKFRTLINESLMNACAAIRKYIDTKNIITLAKHDGKKVIVEFPIEADGKLHKLEYNEKGHPYIEIQREVTE